MKSNQRVAPKPFRLANRTFKGPGRRWIKIEWICGNTVHYNCSGSTQWAGGRLSCSRAKMKTILLGGNYSV